MSKVEDSIRPHLHAIFNGQILVIDPSSGSKNSQPGYAIYKYGILQDSGIIQIQYKTGLNNRLYQLSRSLREQFETPDILVTENIPPVIMGKSGSPGGFFNMSMLSLQKSIGVVISCFDCPLIEVAPVSWRRNIPEGYLKTDENDSIMMGFTVLKLASKLDGRPDYLGMTDTLKHKLTTGKWGE